MAKSKSMCNGCRQDYYNHNREGGCWSFGRARIIKRVKVGTWEPPPYAEARAEKYLSCYSPEGSSMLALDDSRVVADVQKTRDRWNSDEKARANTRL